MMHGNLQSSPNIVRMIHLLIILLTINAAVGVNVVGRTLVVITAPQGYEDEYYGEWFDDVFNYQVQFVKKVAAGTDNVVIIAKEGYVFDKYSCALPGGYVIKGAVGDIWTRDFGAAKQESPRMFQYNPNYIPSVALRDKIRASFLGALATAGVNIDNDFVWSDVILDGGNYVDNHLDSLVVTTRVFKDNKKWLGSKKKVKQFMTDSSGYSNIAYLKELNGDTTGHSDGMVSFIDDTSLAITSMGKGKNRKFTKILKKELPTISNIFVLPNEGKYKFETWSPDGKNKFSSACGLHVNLLATADYLYIPTFGDDPANQESRPYDKALDEAVVGAIKENTSKQVVEIPVPNKVCRMGGSVRCLTWQVQGPVADAITQTALDLAGSATC